MRMGPAALTLSPAMEESILRRVAVVGLVWFVASVAHAQTPAAAGAPAPAALAPAAPASSCALMSKVGDQYMASPLLAFNPAMTSMPLPIPQANANVAMVMCNRATIVPEITDYRVLLEMHLPLAIKAGDKTLFLGINKGQLQMGVPEGQSSPDDIQGLRARIDEMQLAMNKAAGASAGK